MNFEKKRVGTKGKKERCTRKVTICDSMVFLRDYMIYDETVNCVDS